MNATTAKHIWLYKHIHVSEHTLRFRGELAPMAYTDLLFCVLSG